eukprot:3296284-Rhodomonas_salina.2
MGESVGGLEAFLGLVDEEEEGAVGVDDELAPVQHPVHRLRHIATVSSSMHAQRMSVETHLLGEEVGEVGGVGLHHVRHLPAQSTSVPHIALHKCERKMLKRMSARTNFSAVCDLLAPDLQQLRVGLMEGSDTGRSHVRTANRTAVYVDAANRIASEEKTRADATRSLC